LAENLKAPIFAYKPQFDSHRTKAQKKPVKRVKKLVKKRYLWKKIVVFLCEQNTPKEKVSKNYSNYHRIILRPKNAH